MDEKYERHKRKLLTSSDCFLKWWRPIKCKHNIQWPLRDNLVDKYKVNSRRNCSNAEISHNIIISNYKMSLNKNNNRFIKFWKSKLVIRTCRTLQRYFSDKISVTSEPNNSYELRKSPEHNVFPATECHFTKSGKHGLINCQHSENHSVLRGHRHHASVESCAIYCQLSKHGWYWGGITAREAEELLAGEDDNVFLVRDSYNSHHLLCVSFRCVGRTLHARLRHANGLFSLNNKNFVPVNGISEHCANVNVTTSLFGNPVRLARPLNRFAKLDSLQKICRFTIRQAVSAEAFNKLPLPPNIISYLSIGSDYIVSV